MVEETNFGRQKQFKYYKHLISQTILGKTILPRLCAQRKLALSFDYQSQTNKMFRAGLSRGRAGEAGERRARASYKSH